jgi:hypothetical protein
MPADKLSEQLPHIVASIQGAWCGTIDRDTDAFRTTMKSEGENLIAELGVPDEQVDDLAEVWRVLVEHAIVQEDETADDLLGAFEEKLQADQII